MRRCCFERELSFKEKLRGQAAGISEAVLWMLIIVSVGYPLYMLG